MNHPGVSVVICTHNGAGRLGPTLAHLAAQRVPPNLSWEIVLVDNASTDASASIARSAWPADAPAPLRVVAEPVLGLGRARVRGLDAARYEAVSFVDDDNWVAPDWVATVWEIMASEPLIGACGGQAEAALECEPPAWFARHCGYWAVGRQGDGAQADVGQLWGAGLTVRKSAWDALRAAGFTPLVVGRSGTSLLSGEDLEICEALGLAGWRIRYDARLRMRHFMPRARLTWDYARRLSHGWGVASVSLDPYLMAAGPRGLRARLLGFWTWRLFAAALRVLGRSLHAAARPGEGSAAVLRLAILRGRFRGLLDQRRQWRASVRRVREAAWRRPSP